MSFAGLQLEPYRRRVETVDGIKRCLGAAELDAALATPPKDNLSVYLFEANEAAEPNDVNNGTHRQLNRVTLGVAFALRSKRDPRGEAAAEELRPYRLAVRRRLMGYTPDRDNVDTCDYVGGQALAFADGVLWWVDNYTADETLQVEASHA